MILAYNSVTTVSYIVLYLYSASLGIKPNRSRTSELTVHRHGSNFSWPVIHPSDKN